MSDNHQRRALVTGGSGDLGGAICRRLAADGAHVIVHANGNLARAEQVRDEILSAGGSAEAVAFDVADGDATRAALAALLEAGTIALICSGAKLSSAMRPRITPGATTLTVMPRDPISRASDFDAPCSAAFAAA